MIVAASMSMSFTAIALVVALGLAGAIVLVTALRDNGTERRIRRFNDAEHMFNRRVDAAIDADKSDRPPPSGAR
jgi:Flp pilus assembly protein TadB